jgi:hypothetical protein
MTTYLELGDTEKSYGWLKTSWAKMTPEELERLRNRCKKFGMPFPGE